MSNKTVYARVALCNREVTYNINIKKAAITPLGAMPHPNDPKIYYCGYLTDRIKSDVDEDRKHCRFLGDLIEIDGESRYRCKALDEMAEKKLEFK